MTTFIAINSMSRTFREIESFRLETTDVEGIRFSSIGDRLVTVWSTFDDYAATQQAEYLWNANIAAVVLGTPEEVGAYVEKYVSKLPTDWL